MAMSRKAFSVFAIAGALAIACTASSPSSEPAPTASEAVASPTPSEGTVTALSEPSDSPAPSEAASPSPTPFITPAPQLDAAPTIPVGKAANVVGEVPGDGMVRLSGQVFNAAKGPAAGICVTLGPPIACAVLTDSHGKWVIDVPQGKISWEFHFIRAGTEVGPKVMIEGPFKANSVAVESVTVR